MWAAHPTGSREHLSLASVGCHYLPETRHKAFPICLRLFWRTVHWRLKCEALTTPRGTVGWVCPPYVCKPRYPYMETAR